jgi:hypothetical protein
MYCLILLLFFLQYLTNVKNSDHYLIFYIESHIDDPR